MSAWLTAAAANPHAAPFLYLIAALCLSALAGLRAYLPLAALGVAGTVPGPDGGPLLPLRDGFTALGSPAVIALLVAMAIVEFSMDKSARLANASDTVHVLVRPLAGALILAGVRTPLSESAPILAAALGALIALAVHALNAMVRQAVTALSAGSDNAIASTVEDVIAVAMVLAVLLSPVVALALCALAAVIGYRMLPPLWRRYRRLVRAREASAGAAGSPGTGVGSAPLLGHVTYAPPATPAFSRPLGQPLVAPPGVPGEAAVSPRARPEIVAVPGPAQAPVAAEYTPPVSSWVRSTPLSPAGLAPIPPLDVVRGISLAPRSAPTPSHPFGGAHPSRPPSPRPAVRRDVVIAQRPIRPSSLPPLPASRPGRTPRSSAPSGSRKDVPMVPMVPMEPMGTGSGQNRPGWYDGLRAREGFTPDGFAEEAGDHPTYPPSSQPYPTDAPTLHTLPTSDPSAKGPSRPI